ncbi:AAA family ATPase [Sunxiuqinia sp. A32]|uniref:AAA family ATPase n=1 Tax=Sunxiuqinia sp. A32 TaxID=3461496 RepID=UPI004046450F
MNDPLFESHEFEKDSTDSKTDPNKQPEEGTEESNNGNLDQYSYIPDETIMVKAESDEGTAVVEENNPSKKIQLDEKPKTELAPNKAYYTGKELYEFGVKELPMLIAPLFIKSGITILAGGSDIGKSTLLRQIAISIVQGKDEFLGWKINAEHNSVIYVSTEDDRYAISHLLNKSLGDNYDASSLERLRYIFDSERLVDSLDAILAKNPTDLVIIDALTDIFGGELNQANKVRDFLNRYFILADKYNCLFVFLHHTGKRTEQLPPSKNNLLGSQGIEGKARQVIELRRDPFDNEYRHICVVKGNYLPDEYKSHSFKIKFNENLTFEMTDERVEFEDLVERTEDAIPKSTIRKRIAEMHENKGMSFERISENLISEGTKISKSTAHKYYKEYQMGSINNANPEQDEGEVDLPAAEE